MRVYLTGGSGLLGSHLAERLRERGDEVVCLQRKGSDTRFLKALGCRIVEGNVRDGQDALRTGMEGADALVHGAALVYVGGPWPRLRAVNVDGTVHVLRAAAAAGVKQAIHVSSVAVYGPRDGAVDESDPLDAPLGPTELYARSKREAEAAARVTAESARIPLAIVRPAALYGERDRLLAPRLARIVRLPVIPLLGACDNSVPVVYAGNAAHALERVLDAGGPGAAGNGAGPPRIYDIGMDRRLTQRDLVLGMAHSLGRRPRTVTVPAGLVRQLARLGEAAGLGIPGAGDLTVERLARLSLEENPYRSERLRAELGWEPPFTHEEGLRRTAAWLVEQEELG